MSFSPKESFWSSHYYSHFNDKNLRFCKVVVLAHADLSLKVKQWGLNSWDLILGVSFVQHPHNGLLGSIHFMGTSYSDENLEKCYFLPSFIGAQPLKQNDEFLWGQDHVLSTEYIYNDRGYDGEQKPTKHQGPCHHKTYYFRGGNTFISKCKEFHWKKS